MVEPISGLDGIGVLNGGRLRLVPVVGLLRVHIRNSRKKRILDIRTKTYTNRSRAYMRFDNAFDKIEGSRRKAGETVHIRKPLITQERTHQSKNIQHMQFAKFKQIECEKYILEIQS